MISTCPSSTRLDQNRVQPKFNLLLALKTLPAASQHLPSMTSQNTQSWLSAQLLGSQNGAKADKPTIEPALIQLLDDYFNARTPAATAAARFRSIIIGREENPAQPGKDEWSTFYDPWTLFFTAAEKCPEAQEQLVDLLAAIASLEDDKTSTTSDHVLVWKTLPVFRALYREKWNRTFCFLSYCFHPLSKLKE